jgi:integrase
MNSPGDDVGRLDRYSYRKTRHRGLSFRVRNDGTRTYYGYISRRGRVPLQARLERDAVAEYGDLRGKVAKGLRIAPANVTFADVAEQWYASKHRLRPWTRKLYRAALDNELLPRFGHLRLATIDPDRVARFIRELESRGLTSSTITNYVLPLSGTFAFAVRRGLANSNPCALLTADDRPARRAKRKLHEWSDAEIGALLAASAEIGGRPASRYDYSPLLQTAVYSGLRLGELLGLQWQDIDLEEALLHVRRQFTRTGELAEPKTRRAIRRVPLAPELVKLLAALKLKSKWSHDEAFVFASRNGGPLSHRNVQRRGFEAARDVAGIDASVTFHDLRHAFASYAADRGVPLNVLSEVMGHTHVGITQRTYLHLYDRAAAEAAFRTAMSSDASRSR